MMDEIYDSVGVQQDRVTKDQADYVAASRSELDDALNSASQDEIVWLESDLGFGDGNNIEVPAGVTLASGLNVDAYAAAIHVEENQTGIDAYEDSRITGLSVIGPETRYRRNSGGYNTYIESFGITSEGPNVRVDNCDIFGHSYGIIFSHHSCLVEYSEVHHCPQDGTGYGVRVNESAPNCEIRYNWLNWNRHSVATAGDVGYYAHHNHCGPTHFAHVFDHHDGGTYTEIAFNKVETYERPENVESVNDAPVQGSGPICTVTIRGIPLDTAHIHHNWTYNPDGPIREVDWGVGESWSYPAINQQNVPENPVHWSMDCYSNHFGESPPEDDYIGL